VKKIYTKICPKCKSPDINIDKSNPLQPSLGLPAVYICNKCGFAGRNFPEADISKLKKIKETSKKKPAKMEKSELVDSTYGDFLVRGVWKVYGAIAIIAGIAFLFINKIAGAVLILIGLFLIFFKPLHKK